MWLETICWWIGTIIFSIISFYKQKYFLKNKSFFNDVQTIAKTKEKYIKTIDEQKKYIRARNDLGKDFITLVFGMISFYLIFIILIYPQISTLKVGLITVIIFSIMFSLVHAKFIMTDKHFKYNLINAFMNYFYTGAFLIYVKFIDTLHPIIVLIISIILMIGINYFMEKLYVRKSM